MASIKAQSTNFLVLQKFILEPLSTIIKLAILGKKSVGCKISIKNNQIYIQESGVFQGFTRYYKGNTKNDIHYLSIPIELASKRYLTNEKIKEIPNIIIIFKCAQQGLNNLMETYSEFPIVVHCLKYYNSIIDTHLHLISCTDLLSNKKSDMIFNNPELVYKKKKNKSQHITLSENTDLDVDTNTETVSESKIIDIPNKNEEESKTYENELLLLYTDELLNNFDLIWDKSKIQIIIDMINYLLEEKSVSTSEYAGCIETFMIPIDKESLNIIYSLNNK